VTKAVSVQQIVGSAGQFDCASSGHPLRLPGPVKGPFVRHAATGTVWGYPFSTPHPVREPGSTNDNGLSALVGDIGLEEDTEDPQSANGTDTPGRAF
jgi:hypothetical protein